MLRRYTLAGEERAIPGERRITPYNAAASLNRTGRVLVPSSKSHTIRALLAAAWSDGLSRIENALDSADARSCIAAIETLGARVEILDRGPTGLTLSVAAIPLPEAISSWEGTPQEGAAVTASQEAAPQEGAAAAATIDVGNSGTTLYLLAAMAATLPYRVCFDGDASIRSRSAGPLLEALRELGATVEGGPAAPFCVEGPIRAGRTVALESPTSQYLSALLLAAPLAAPAAVGGGITGEATTTIDLLLLNERPYVDMTCWWLDRLGVEYTREGYDRFIVGAGFGAVAGAGTGTRAERYRALDSVLPGDYSSASFWFCAAAITGVPITVEGLDPTDVQGDREVLAILEQMGCTVTWDNRAVTVSDRAHDGGVFDCNAIPDALPILAATAAYAEQPVELVNVPQARAKETDRIAVMAKELGALGVQTAERPDGLKIHPSRPTGGEVSSHGDHRVAMACAVAALGAEGPVLIRDADAAAVTYPRFFDDLEALFPGAVEVSSER